MAEGQVVGGYPPEVKSGRMRAGAFGMFIIGMTMWVGVPLVWLYIGSQIKAEADSLGLALAVMGIGALATIVGLVKLLGAINRSWTDEFIELNDRKPKRTPLEPVLVISAMLALAVFGLGILFVGGAPTAAPQ
ncbi:MAG: hypothetical protein ACRDKE_05290 [Solirubrobacterales bacterium]